MPLRPARTQRSTRGLYKLYPTRRNHREKAQSCSRMCLITSSRQDITFPMPLALIPTTSKNMLTSTFYNWNFVMVARDPWRQPLALPWMLVPTDTLNFHTLSMSPAPHPENRALSSGCNSPEELFSLARAFSRFPVSFSTAFPTARYGLQTQHPHESPAEASKHHGIGSWGHCSNKQTQ